MPPKLKIVELKVVDWHAAITWFAECFELKPLLVDESHQYALLGNDYGVDANLALRGTVEKINTHSVLLQWEVEDLAGTLALLKARGVGVLKPIAHASDEWYQRAIIAGPEGIPMLLFEFDKPHDSD